MLQKTLRLIERGSAYLQGKGWGSGTLKQEFQNARSIAKNKKIPLCIDIGGNKGNYASIILKYSPLSEIVIFEPSAINIEILERKFKENKNVTIVGSAVYSKAGSAVLFTNENGSPLASLTRRRLDHFGIEICKKEDISTVVFEDYWRDSLMSRRIDLCKIDIEGHELDALAGFGDALNYTDVIQFEFGGTNIDTRTYFQDFWYFFKDHGFEIYRITPFGINPVNVYRESDETFTITNYLAKRIE